MQPKTPDDYAAELSAQAATMAPGPDRDHLDWLIEEWRKVAQRDVTRLPTVSEMGKLGRKYH